MSNLTDTLIIKDASETTDQASTKNVTQEVISVLADEKSPLSDVTSKDASETTDQAYVNTENKEVTRVTSESLLFTRENIEALGNDIQLVDSDEENKLDMFCYVKCSESDNELLKQCRGVVFNGKDIVMKAFPYTLEYNHEETDRISDVFTDLKEWTFYEAHEGALIRMFYFNEKWYVSTHRKLNAFRSKWACRESFGTSFKTALISEEKNNEKFASTLPAGDNILERFQTTLDTSKQYMFLVRNNENNRIVCDSTEHPTLFHVGTFVDGKLTMEDDINIPYSVKLKFQTVEEMLESVSKMSYRNIQGIIGFTSDNRQVKIYNKDYQDLFRARGNEPSIKYRYLQVRMNRRFVNMLYHLYPKMADVFDDYENTLYDISRSIYRSYVQRFIKKRYVTVPKDEYAVIRECHSWHLQDRTNNRISVEKVIHVMNTQSPTHLNHMIRRFKMEQNRQNRQTDDQNVKEAMESEKSFEQSPAIRHINAYPVSPLVLSQSTFHRAKNPRITSILPRKTLPENVKM